MPGVNKWRHDFLCHVFHLVFAVRGRINLKNLSRYSDFNETTIHRHFSMSFDFAQFNSDCIYQLRHQERHWMAAADCSFITKSGKCTYGLDKFWSSVANSEKTGLEISAVSLIDIHSGEAYMLDVEQTPAGLSPKEDTQSDTKVPGQYGKAARRARRSRIDFYIEQLDRVRPQLARHGVSHVALDGYYTKYKVFEAFDEFAENDDVPFIVYINFKDLFGAENLCKLYLMQQGFYDIVIEKRKMIEAKYMQDKKLLKADKPMQEAVDSGYSIQIFEAH